MQMNIEQLVGVTKLNMADVITVGLDCRDKWYRINVSDSYYVYFKISLSTSFMSTCLDIEQCNDIERLVMMILSGPETTIRGYRIWELEHMMGEEHNLFDKRLYNNLSIYKTYVPIINSYPMLDDIKKAVKNLEKIVEE